MRMAASSISKILRRRLPSTSRCISFVTSNSQTLFRREPTFASSLEHSSSVLPISGKNYPLKLQLLGGNFCTASGDEKNSRCWNCDASLEQMPLAFCDSCGKVQPVDKSHDFDWFQYFGQEKKYEIDMSILEEKYKHWQNKLHPDVVQTKSEKEREYAADQLERVTKAYLNLKSPVSRAAKLLDDISVNEKMDLIDTAYDMDPKLLKKIIEMRTAIEEANDLKAVGQIESQVEEKMKLWSDSFGKAFEGQKFDEAVTCVQMMTYYKRADAEIWFKARLSKLR